MFKYEITFTIALLYSMNGNIEMFYKLIEELF